MNSGRASTPSACADLDAACGPPEGADADRPAFMDHANTFLNLVKGELFSANPDNQF